MTTALLQLAALSVPLLLCCLPAGAGLRLLMSVPVALSAVLLFAGGTGAAQPPAGYVPHFQFNPAAQVDQSQIEQR